MRMKSIDKKTVLSIILVVFVSFVFLQSLFFKFTGATETQYIFTTLDQWALDTFGISGLFVPPGIFNAYVIGMAELVASLLLVTGTFSRYKVLLPVGAFAALNVMSGAIFFHLFTPLGIEVQDDGGALFSMACAVWLSSIGLFVMHYKHVLSILGKA